MIKRMIQRFFRLILNFDATEWDIESPTNSTPNSRYAKVWKDGFMLLRFPPEVEIEYLQSRSKSKRRRIATGAVVGLIGIGLWLGLDAALGEYFQFTVAWTTLGGAGLIIALSLVLFVLFQGKYESYIPLGVTTVRVCIGLAFIYLQTVMELRGMEGAIYPYVALLIFLGLAFMSGMMTWYTTLAGSLIALIFGISQLLLLPLAFYHPGYDLFFLSMMLVIGTAGSWRLEHKDREQFLLSKILAQLAEHDSLSGLLNHGAFVSHCERAWKQAAREGKPVSLITLDIDYFKSFNDYYGHPAGDHCIAQVGTIINQRIRRGMDAGARLGGEEFATFWYDLPQAEANKIAEDIRQAIEGLAIPHKPSSVSSWLTVSVGVLCVNPQPSQSFGVALQAVDNALYRAKEAGRNRVVVELGLLEAHEATFDSVPRRQPRHYRRSAVDKGRPHVSSGGARS